MGCGQTSGAPSVAFVAADASEAAPGSYDAASDATLVAADGGLVGSMPSDGSTLDGADAADAADADGVLDTQVAGKMLFGYQGWFACPGDGSLVNRWQHWLDSSGAFQVDMWPDLSEFSAPELFPLPGATLPDGGSAPVFSAFPSPTVARHFEWMRTYGLDGALLQRFLGEVQDPVFFAFRNQVTTNVMSAAQSQGRLFAIEYDITGVDDTSGLAELQKDWMYLVDTVGVLESGRYLQYGSKPALFVWGFGFSGGTVTSPTASQMIAWLQSGAAPRYRVAVVGGVPSGWRTLSGDSSTDAAWASVYRSLDALSPWSVGRYVDDASADQYRQTVTAPDLAELTPLGIGYLPVVFPGFSWHNLNGGPLNQIPRSGGSFYWRQVYNAIGAGATMLKTAMFDEMNEGTAMFKLQPTTSSVPTQASFVTLDIDGLTLRSDHYLSLGGEATQMLHGDIPLTATMPTVP